MIRDLWNHFWKSERKRLRKRPMCFLAIGFLLILCMFGLGRSYQNVLYSEDLGEVFLEGIVTEKQYKESAYGGYWQVTLKKVRVLRENRSEELEKTGREESVGAEDVREKADGAEADREEAGRANESLYVFKGKDKGTFRNNANAGKIETLEGKYLCQITAGQEVEVKIGQRLLMKGRYYSFEEPTNPGQFNVGKYYCSQGILGQFKKCNLVKQGSEFSKFRESMWQIRQTAHEFLKQELGEEDGALLSAMCLGEKSSLDEEDKSLYQRNGISHILAISGLHLMLLGMGVFRGLKIILGSNRQVTAVSIIIMSVYCVFTGNSISTIRATIMFALSLIAPVLGRSYDSLSALGLAAILQLFMNPYVLNNSGFLLSFLAVIGVTFLAQKLQELLGVKGKLGKSLCVSISSTLTTLPVLLCNYGTYPWYSVFLNLLVIPLMSVLLFLAVLLLLLGMPCWMGGNLEAVYWAGLRAVQEKEAVFSSIGNGFAKAVSMREEGNTIFAVMSECLYAIKTGIVFVIKAILQYFEICCRIFEHAPFQDGYLGAPKVVQIIVYGCLVLAALSGIIRHSVLARKMILMSAISILTLQLNIGAEVTMLDVGQGDSVVIRNANGNVYISDCGSSSVSNVGKYRLVPFLKYKGYGRIKGIFISHMDNDHMNGIVELLEMAPQERIEIAYLFLPESVLVIEEDREDVEELVKLAKQNKTEVVYLKQGDKIVDDKMQFYCLYPKSGAKEKDRNNQSLVMLMQYKDFDMLFTGDVEKNGEEEMMEKGKQESEKKVKEEEKQESEKKVKEEGKQESEKKVMESIEWGSIEVLKVAHHGSSGSSSEAFLEWIQPKLSLISCGKNNSYGHPHEETLQRLEEAGSEILTTVDCGAITIRIRYGNLEVDCYSDEK